MFEYHSIWIMDNVLYLFQFIPNLSIFSQYISKYQKNVQTIHLLQRIEKSIFHQLDLSN